MKKPVNAVATPSALVEEAVDRSMLIRPDRRRRWPAPEKNRILAEADEAGAVAAEGARGIRSHNNTATNGGEKCGGGRLGTRSTGVHGDRGSRAERNEQRPCDLSPSRHRAGRFGGVGTERGQLVRVVGKGFIEDRPAEG